MKGFIDYYKILGIAKNATDDEIKRAYRAAAMKCHPDRHPGEEQAKYEELFKLVREAYEQLGGKNKNLRREYDQKWEAYYKRKQSSQNKRTTGHQQTRYKESTKTQTAEDTKTAWDKVKQAWQEVREDEKKEPFFERHAKVDKSVKYRDKKARTEKVYYEDQFGNEFVKLRTRERTKVESFTFPLKRGTMHVAYEFLTQLEKLTHISDDTVTKFAIRNRKTAAGILAASIIFSGFGSNVGSNMPHQTDQYVTSTTVDGEMSYGEDVLLSEAERQEAEKINQPYTVYRKYNVEYGDTLSHLAEAANCTIREIETKNNIDRNSLLQAKKEIYIPYHIDSGDLRYATYSAYITPGISLSDFADKYSTTVDSIIRLNEESIEDGQVLTNSLLVPNFNTKKQINEQKETTTNKTYTYRSRQ